MDITKPTVNTDRQDWAAEVAGGLRALPDAQAQALRLIYCLQLSFDETAERLGVTRREASVTIAEGLRRLGELLQAGARTPGLAASPAL